MAAVLVYKPPKPIKTHFDTNSRSSFKLLDPLTWDNIELLIINHINAIMLASNFKLPANFPRTI